MRKILLLLFTFISLVSAAQIRVKENSFREIGGYVMFDKNDHYDDNDKPMALIKISTENISAEERARFIFNGNLETYFDVQFMTGEIHLYLSTAATFIEIIHPDYGKTEFNLPETLKPFAGYEMIIVSDYYNDDNAAPKVNYLIINTDQTNAMIFIDGEFVGLKDVSKLLSVGDSHTWRIECDMYHTESGKVTISQGEPLVVEKKLRPAYGYVNVVTKPKNDAKVYIDNIYVGKTPYFSNKMKVGTHKMVVAKDSYKPSNHEFVVTDNDTAFVNVEMIPNIANITVITDSLSSIYIDNQMKGVGKWNGDVSLGTHLIETRKASHKTAYYDVDLRKDNYDTVYVSDPKPIYGWLNVTTNPIGAEIYIDGVYCNETPRIVKELLIGEHELRLEKEGYALSIRKINVKEDETLTLNEMLVPGKDITIETDRQGDKIYVDKQYVGLSPQTINMTYGTHTIMVERDGYVMEEDFIVELNGNSKKKLIFGKEVTISTDHKGDYIYVDNVEVGTSPCVVSLSYGKHSLTVKRGKFTFDKIIVIERNTDVDAINFNLGKEITINTTENGDKVYIDNVLVGKTPLNKYMTFGTHNIKVEKGTKSVTKNIDVKDGGQSEFTFYYGQLVKFDSSKAGDAVFVDGKKQGHTPLELDLSFGNHNVMVKRHRKVDKRDIYVAKGNYTDFSFYPTRETVREFNENGVSFFTVNASTLKNQLSYGLSCGSYRGSGWYMSVMTNFDVTDSTNYTGLTQFLPKFNESSYVYPELTETVVNSRLSALFGMMFTVGGPIYLKLGGGYGLYSSYTQTVDGEWYKNYGGYQGWLLSTGIQLNMKNLIMSADVVTNTDFDMIELKVGFGIGWKKK